MPEVEEGEVGEITMNGMRSRVFNKQNVMFTSYNCKLNN